MPTRECHGGEKIRKSNKTQPSCWVNVTRFRRRRRRGSSHLWILWPWRFGCSCCWPTSSSLCPCGWWLDSRLTSGTTMWTAAGWAAGVTTANTIWPAALAASTRSCNCNNNNNNNSSITMSFLTTSIPCWPAATISRWPTVSGLPLALWCSKDPISIPRYFLWWSSRSLHLQASNLNYSYIFFFQKLSGFIKEK